MSARRRLMLTLTVGLVALSPLRSSAQSSQSLASLTVPVARLPKGCRLEPVNPNATGAARFVMYPGVHENPWVGTERPAAASIRQVVDGPAGPTNGLVGPASRDKLAEGVVESYVARYLSADQQIDVYAVRFNDPALTRAASMTPLIADPSVDRRPRIVRGTIAALVFQSSRPGPRPARGPGDACLRAVTAHIAAIK